MYFHNSRHVQVLLRLFSGDHHARVEETPTSQKRLSWCYTPYSERVFGPPFRTELFRHDQAFTRTSNQYTVNRTRYSPCPRGPRNPNAYMRIVSYGPYLSRFLLYPECFNSTLRKTCVDYYRIGRFYLVSFQSSRQLVDSRLVVVPMPLDTGGLGDMLRQQFESRVDRSYRLRSFGGVIRRSAPLFRTTKHPSAETPSSAP